MNWNFFPNRLRAQVRRPIVWVVIAAVVAAGWQPASAMWSRGKELVTNQQSSNQSDVAGQLGPRQVAVKAGGQRKWSDPATWGGKVPAAGSVAVIPSGTEVLLDVNPPPLDGIDVLGKLEVQDRPTKLTVGYLHVSGEFRMGTLKNRFKSQAELTLTGQPGGDVMGMGTRGIMVHGGKLRIFAKPPKKAWTTLADHAEQGAKELRLVTEPGWREGDQVAVAPSDLYGVAETESFRLTAAADRRVSLSGGLAKFRWGKLQYATRNGMSLDPDPGFKPPTKDVPTVLDERAEVANLSRNVVIQGADDDAWRNSGFGAQIMVMGPDSSAQVNGIEIRRGGQAGKQGRYPMHWHLHSYRSDGSPGPDAKGDYLKNSTIWDSSNRCLVLHATNGVKVVNNVCFDVKGHAFFLEDAVERRNTLSGNLALHVRNPGAGDRLQVHEGDVFQGGSSGYWLTNPDNKIVNNRAADTQGNGFWMAFPRRPLGLSKAVKMLPDRVSHGAFDGNVAHSAQKPGIMMEWAPVDDAGNVSPNKYIPTKDEGEDRFDENRVRFTLRKNVSYKNNEGGYRNRASAPDYLRWVTADNVGPVFAGAGDDGVITEGLVVGTSLNKANGWPNFPSATMEPPVAFASYHSTFAFTDNLVVGFPFVPGKLSGAFKTDDYYLSGIDKGLVRNPGNMLVDSHPGYRYLPPAMREDDKPEDNWTLSGALWDPHGYWGPKGNFWVYDVPFLTTGADCREVQPAGKNSMSCDGQYYGVQDFAADSTDRGLTFKREIKVHRVRPDGSVIGTWSVDDGNSSNMLGNMRHFAARPGGRYVMTFPGTAAPTRNVEMDMTNAYRDGDSFLMAVSWAGTSQPKVFTTSAGWHRRSAAPGPKRRDMSAAASLSAVENSDGNKYWVDSARQLLWFKYVGGLPTTPAKANSDDDLYRTHSVVITAS